jgi:hypothetical protein
MPTTEDNTLTLGADGYGYQISGRGGIHDVWTLAELFGIDEENETLRDIAVIREMFARYDYHRIRDYETFGTDEPRSLRDWIRAYRLRFENDLPLYQQLAMRAARKQQPSN